MDLSWTLSSLFPCFWDSARSSNRWHSCWGVGDNRHWRSQVCKVQLLGNVQSVPSAVLGTRLYRMYHWRRRGRTFIDAFDSTCYAHSQIIRDRWLSLAQDCNKVCLVEGTADVCDIMIKADVTEAELHSIGYLYVQVECVLYAWSLYGMFFPPLTPQRNDYVFLVLVFLKAK